MSPQPRPIPPPPAAGPAGEDDATPEFLPMIRLVAVVVIVVILVFFGIGYLFGRVFL